MLDGIKFVLSKLGLLGILRKSELYHAAASKLNKELRAQIRAEMNFYGLFVKSGGVCFDVGASYGGKTNVFHKMGARVVAVEPDPEAFSILAKKFRGINEIILLNNGLGAVPGELLLNRSTKSTLSTFDNGDVEATLKDERFSNTTFFEKCLVKVDTLDNLVAQYGIPDYCKISTVGYEIEVLKGLSVPVKTISITCNVPQHIEKTIECLNLMDKLDTYKYNYYLSTLLNGFVETSWLTGSEMKKRLEEMKHTPDHSRYIEIFAMQSNT